MKGVIYIPDLLLSWIGSVFIFNTYFNFGRAVPHTSLARLAPIQPINAYFGETKIIFRTSKYQEGIMREVTQIISNKDI